MGKHLLGIDLGTSSVKAAIIDLSGSICGLGKVPYEIVSPQPGWAEQDPEVWWKAVIAAIRIAAEQASISDKDDVIGIGLSGQMHGLVALDEDLRLLYPAIIWADQRSVIEVEEYIALLGHEQIARITANPVSTGFMGPSLMWLMKHKPEIYSKIRWVLLPKDYIRFRLTGEIGTEITDASSTLLFDTGNCRWSEKVCKTLGLQTYYLPPCSKPWEQSGTLSASSAYATGLKPGIPVAFGGSDQPMQAIGNSIVEPNTVSVTLGTAGQVFTPVKQPVYDSDLRTHTFCNVVPDTWYVMGGTMAAGLSFSWFSKVISCSDMKVLDHEAASIPPGSNGLLFLPYLIGERTPHMDPLARGAFIGLTTYHTRAHLVRAVMEGVVYALSETLDIMREIGLPMERLIASGGGVASSVWRQIIADVFHHPLMLTNAQEQACIGAALTAGTAVGAYPAIKDACRIAVPKPVQMEDPIAENVEAYQAILRVYKKAYSSNKQIFHELAERR